jgi:diaminopimelate decarboxylase
VLVEFINDLRSSGLVIHELDFGGGFGVQYRGYLRHEQLPKEGEEETNISAAVLVKTVLPLLQEAECAIAIQPGRSIIAHPGVLLTKVLFRKQTEEKLFVIVDGGMNDLLRPSLYNAYHQLVPLELKNQPHEVADIVGPLCETGDFFARDRLVPRLHRGEYAALMCAGAYGYALSSNYNARPRPAEILVDGSAMRVIRKRETLDDL